MVKVFVNGKETEVPEEAVVLDACIAAGVSVPHLCAHKKLGTGGSCQLCLVSVDGVEKPVMSCCTKVQNEMHIQTDTEQVKDIRREMIQLLFARHPAECSVCQKSGSCGIQDICFANGQDKTEFKEPNRPAVREQDLGPLIETHLERCILCMKCVHFLRDVAGNDELFPLGRSDTTQIKACVDGTLSSVLSGNLLDLCPAGALTDKTAQFLWRPWELSRTDSIDVMDAVGSHITVSAAQGQIVCITPKECPEINGSWISDKTRFAFDGLADGRIDRPYIRVNGQLKECSWTEAFMTVASKIKTVKPGRIAGLAGGFADCESMMVLRDLIHSAGSNAMDARLDETFFDVKKRQSWLFNTGIAGIEKADALLMIGTDVELEAPVLNARLRNNRMPKALVGEKINLAYPYDYLGETPDTLKQIAEGTHPFCTVLEQASFPMLIVGKQAVNRPDAPAILDLLYRIVLACKMNRPDWNGFNFLADKASLTGALELGIVPEISLYPRIKKGEFDIIFLLNEDGISREDMGNSFVVYQGIYGSRAALAADVVLPGLAYTEKRATYVNIEGRAQSTVPVLSALGKAREDWKILRALSDYLENPLPYDTLESIRDHMAGENMIFHKREEIFSAEQVPFGTAGQVSSQPFTADRFRFFHSDEICRRSGTMRRLEKVWHGGKL